MKKVLIIGCPESGKSTFGRRLKEATALPLYHLDMIYWKDDKTTLNKEIFLEKLNKLIKEPKWIIDGNYGSTMELRIKNCDTVFFLDYKTEVCLEGIKNRAGIPRSDIPWVEGEETDEEFIEFIKSYNQKEKPKVMKLLEKYSSKNIVIFHTREESEKYLLSVKK